MRLNNMVEEIRQQHPNAGRVQVIFDLNRALLEYTEETRLLYGRAVLDRTASLISEDRTKNITRWQLPQDVFEVNYTDNVAASDYYLDGNQMVIHWIDPYMQSLRVEYFRYPLAIALDADEPEIPQRFHEAIVCRVMEKYHLRAGNNLVAAKYYGGLYQELVRAAKKYSNTKARRNENPSVGGVLTITTFKTGLTLTQGINTITMDKKFTTKSSFAILPNGNGVTVMEYSSVPSDPHYDRTTSSFKVFAADPVTASFDYIVTGN